MKAVISITAAAGLAALALAGCAAGKAAPAPTVTVPVTHTDIRTQTTTEPAPTVTKTVTRTVAEPAPTVTQTVSVPAPAPAAGQPSGGGPASGGQPGAGQVIVKFNGSGTQNTASFTTPGSWALSWSYWGCPNGTSNFQVTEYNADGTPDLNGISVNELGTGRGPVATYAYGDAGTHYLAVNTEGCSWSLVPVTV